MESTHGNVALSAASTRDKDLATKGAVHGGAPDKPYFQYLDALRALAFFAVFYAHMGTIFTGTTITDDAPLGFLKKFMVYGSYGVNFFFVLSGFLITFLLLKEKQQYGTVSIKNFYVKRILRIWPVYFITLFFGAFVLPFIIPSETYSVFTMTNPHVSQSAFTWFLLFVGNFYQGLSLGMGGFAIGILWSVCVEEQFYLVWPWVVKHLSIRRLAACIVGIIILTLAYKFAYAEDRYANYYLPWSVGMDLAFGSLLGLLFFTKKIRRAVLLTAAVFSISLALIGKSYIDADDAALTEMLRLLKTPILDSIFMMVILYFALRVKKFVSAESDGHSADASASHPIMKALHISKQKIKSALLYCGQISYGLYAYHATCLILTVHVLFSFGLLDSKTITRPMFLLTATCAMALSILVAHLSSRLIEKRIMRYRDRLKY